jgi:hypothetical protein
MRLDRSSDRSRLLEVAGVRGIGNELHVAVGYRSGQLACESCELEVVFAR